MFHAEFVISPALESRLRSFAPTVEQDLKSALRDEADDIATEARRRAPFQTGTLRRSIEAGYDADGWPIVAARAPYARRIEYGFVGADSRGRRYHQAAKPYLRPSIDERKDAIRQAVRRAVKDSAARHLGGFITR